MDFRSSLGRTEMSRKHGNRSCRNRISLQRSLARRLGLTTATALIVGEVIGVGIFLTPAEMAKSLGSPFWLLVVWLAMAVATVGGALCYGALAARYPEAGGTYVYLREIFGKRTAFLYGWLSLLVTDPGLTAMLAVGLARYVGHLVPWARGQLGLLRPVSIIALAAVNALGGAPGSRVLGALAVLQDRLAGFSRRLGIWSGARRLGKSDTLLDPAAGIRSASSRLGCCAGWRIHRVRGLVGREQDRR